MNLKDIKDMSEFPKLYKELGLKTHHQKYEYLKKSIGLLAIRYGVSLSGKKVTDRMKLLDLQDYVLQHPWMIKETKENEKL